jgi:glycosyltransferase involved in cell wall biosynthesis
LLNIFVSIITVSHNSILTISDTIMSVLKQTYPHIEYIIVDGGSKDGTVELIESFGDKINRFVSEPDLGIYDAINKGIRLAKGDIIGVLNSDDYFFNETVVKNVVTAFADNDFDAVYGDIRFVDKVNSSKVVRSYSSKRFHPGKFKYGFMPAHPSFYAKRELFERYGYYKTDYKIAADYELLMRFILVNQIRCKYLGIPFVNMRTGGVSNKSIFSNYLLNKEILRACRENGVSTNYAYIYSKYLFKIFEYFGN